MVTAISTTESSNIQIPALPNAKTFCAMAAVLVLAASTTGTASVPMQTFAISQNTFFSTDTANRNSYNNGNISLWLEGDSVMSVDKAQVWRDFLKSNNFKIIGTAMAQTAFQKVSYLLRGKL